MSRTPAPPPRPVLAPFGGWALAAGLAWLALGVESIVRPAAQDHRDVVFLVPWALTLAALTALHRAQRPAGDRLERIGFGLVAVSMVGAAVLLVPIAVVPVWVVGMVVLGVGTRRAGVAPGAVGVLIAVTQPATVLTGLALSPWVPLESRGSYSGAVAHGVCFLAMAVLVRRTEARRVGRALAAAAVLAGVVAGCGSDEEAAGPVAVEAESTTEAETTTTTDPAPHEGDIEVVARDFGFEDLPARIAAGPHTLRFDNQGTEQHELFLFRNPDGLTLEEIHALGPAGAPQAVELAGLVIVEPGKADEIEVDLTPGEYEVACFIPTPTDGRAHFEHGMHATITVE